MKILKYYLKKLNFFLQNDKKTLNILTSPKNYFENLYPLLDEEYIKRKTLNQFEINFFVKQKLHYFNKFIDEKLLDENKIMDYLFRYYFLSEIKLKDKNTLKCITKKFNFPTHNEFTIKLFLLNIIISDFLNQHIRNKAKIIDDYIYTDNYIDKHKLEILEAEIVFLHLTDIYFNYNDYFDFKLGYITSSGKVGYLNELKMFNRYNTNILLMCDLGKNYEKIDPKFLI